MIFVFSSRNLNLVMAAVISAAIHIVLLLLPVYSYIGLNKKPETVMTVQFQREAGRGNAENQPDVVDKHSELLSSVFSGSESEKPASALKEAALLPQFIPIVPEITPEFRADLYKSPKDIEQPAHVLHIEMWQPLEVTQSNGGRLILKIYVGENGKADFIEYETKDLSIYFAERVKDSFLKANYTPGYFGGRPIKSWVKVEIRYDVLPAQGTR